MTGIMQISTAITSGPGVADLEFVPDEMPAALSIAHRWEAYAAVQDIGEKVLSSRDIIGGKLLTAASAATAPTLVLDQGQLAFEFDGVDDALRGIGLIQRAQPYTITVVARALDVAAGAHVVIGGGGTNGRGAIFADGANWRANAGSSFGLVGAVDVTAYQIVTVVFNGANSVIRVDGSEIAGNVGAENATDFLLGCLGGGSSYFKGRVRAVYYAARAWTAAERKLAEDTIRTNTLTN